MTCHSAHDSSVMPMPPPHPNIFRHGSFFFFPVFLPLVYYSSSATGFSVQHSCWAVEVGSSLLAGKACILPSGTPIDEFWDCSYTDFMWFQEEKLQKQKWRRQTLKQYKCLPSHSLLPFHKTMKLRNVKAIQGVYTLNKIDRNSWWEERYIQKFTTCITDLYYLNLRK